ncbi:MAG: replication-relaxation family protein [Oscillospiraceae bacterium]|nr:replication-relaxation family protein [Oscillospiraceae bacterium]
MTTRITKRKLEEYNQTLNQRDKAVLRSLQTCQFLKTDQVGRLHFQSAATPAAGLRAATRLLAKLHGLGLVQPLQRRYVNWIHTGTTSYIWSLKTAGAELLRLDEGRPPAKSRKRVFEPTYIFLKHTLMIAELYTRLFETEKLMQADFEPDCWRRHHNALGGSICLKPDLYSITAADGFEDHWFFEVDLDTEAPKRIMQKCENYGRYYLTGREQEKTGVFPRVAWIVPDIKRRDTLWRHICEHLSEYQDLFVVILFDDLDTLIASGAGAVMNGGTSEYLSRVDDFPKKGF